MLTITPCELLRILSRIFFFFQAEDGIRDYKVTGVQTCALPICRLSCEVACTCAEVKPELSDDECHADNFRSEERRVGKECRCRWCPDQKRKMEIYEVMGKLDRFRRTQDKGREST